MLEEKDLQAVQKMLDTAEERITEKTRALIAESEERTAKRTVALMDLEFNKKFDALLEGQQAILAQMVPTTRVEALEDDVKVLKIVIRQLSEEVQRMKQAQ